MMIIYSSYQNCNKEKLQRMLNFSLLKENITCKGLVSDPHFECPQSRRWFSPVMNWHKPPAKGTDCVCIPLSFCQKRRRGTLRWRKDKLYFPSLWTIKCYFRNNMFKTVDFLGTIQCSNVRQNFSRWSDNYSKTGTYINTTEKDCLYAIFYVTVSYIL